MLSPRWRRFASTAVIALVATVVAMKLRARNQLKARTASEAKRNKVQQRERDPALVNPSEKKLFTGLRVVDMSTHIAAPNVGRCLADLGAEGKFFIIKYISRVEYVFG